MSSSTPAYLNDLIQTAVPVRPLRSSDAPLLNVPRTRTEFARVGLFRSRLRTLETHYHPTLDPAVLWTPSNYTSRPICSDSLNLMPRPPAPLYLRTLWRYTNAVIIISEREREFTSAICRRPSVCLSSICLSSVCNVRGPYSGDWNFRQFFYAVEYLGHQLTSR